EGDVDSKGHEGWIELESAQFGAARKVTPPGGAAGRESSTPAVSEITINKVHDGASTDLFKESLSGTGKKVIIDFVKTGSDGSEIYLEIELEACVISSYSVSGSGSDPQSRPQETLTLNYTKITYTYIPSKSDNSSSSPKRTTWDLGTQSH
ncbi:MAG TPA: type VI secretion system tube protein Hcp, partial [Gemmataceae bacterium]|nr:type VI secretion system tube protein Hcp [Gemmataceae bacterium]